MTVFFLIPLFLAIGIAHIRVVDANIIGNINVVLAIFISMLFAMISILCSLSLRYSYLLLEKQ